MTTDTVVMDVSQDWITACDVQQRFMQHPGATIDALTYSARCRQVRALGGDCFDVLPLSQNRFALAVGDASGKSLAAALMISSVQSSLRTAASFAARRKFSCTRIVSRRPTHHIILWCFRRNHPHSTLRQCRPQSSHSHSARSLDDSASGRWRAGGHFPELDL
jgi:hypothetical protein